MCTLAIYFRTFADYPVVIAANRDEYLARPASSPTTLGENPHIVGGKDLRASGTWLGINEHGLVAALLNRRAVNNGEADPNLRSRGLLCLDALRARTAGEAARLVEGQRGAGYNPFNLLIASREAAYVACNLAGGPIKLVSLTPGFHLLTNVDIDDFECPRISRSYGRFASLCEQREFARDPLARRDEVERLLADHSTQLDARSGRPNSLCLHLGAYGTRSSSLIFMGREAGMVEHFFAAGPPCITHFERAAVPHRHPA
ncbi:MAG: NRDE family protein [Candidatus Binataceae bacterium]